MARYTGTDGELNVGSAVGQINSFTVEESCDVQTAAEMGVGWKNAEPGINEWSGSLEVTYDPADAGQAVLTIGAKISGAVFYPAGNTSNRQSMTGNIVVSSLSTPANSGELIKQSISFVGDGELVKATIA